jgi:hypothetical protein
MASWANELFDAFDAHGCSLRVDSLKTRSLLGEAGFVDIEEEIIKVPVNGWHPDPTQKELGRYLCLGLTRGLYGMSLAPLARMKNLSREQVMEKAERVKVELADRRIHAYCQV